MGKLIQGTLMDWDQPRRVRRFMQGKVQQRRAWYRRPVVVVASAAMFMLLWLVSGRKIAFALAIGVSMGIGLVFVYVLPLLAAFTPSVVKIMEEEIRVSEAGCVTQWRYEAIKACAILPIDCEGETAHLLAITLADGEHGAVAIAPEVSLDELRAVLTERGVQVGASASEDEAPEPQGGRLEGSTA